MRKILAAMIVVAASGCGDGKLEPPQVPVDASYVDVEPIRPFMVDGHEYYMVSRGENRVAVDNHECKKCRSQMLQHFEELTKP